MRIAFLTTSDPIYLPDFFEHVLDAYGQETHAVYVVPPLYKGQSYLAAARRYYRTFGFEGVRGLGRRLIGAKLRRKSIGSIGKRHGVTVADRPDVNAPPFLAELERAGVDVLVSVSCPQIFRADLIKLPAKGCLNVHGALLPKYRGVLPSFWMLANGEEQAGVSVYFVNEQVDAGDLCGQRSFPIFPSDTVDSLLRRSKAEAAAVTVEVLEAIESGTVERHPLDLTGGSYYSWPDAEAVKRFRVAGRRLW
jgi:methionyl-tRNA formyltransferase